MPVIEKVLVPSTPQPKKRGPVKGSYGTLRRPLRASSPLSMEDIAARGAVTVTQEYLHRRIAPVLEAALQSAEIVGRDGAADRRLVCELAGLLVRQVDINQTVTTKRAADSMPDAVVIWYYQLLGWPRDRWMPGLRDRYDQGLITPMPPDVLPPGLPAPSSALPSSAQPSASSLDGVPPRARERV